MKRQESLSKYNRAKRKMERLKSFYTHLVIYIIINLVITGFKVSNNLDNWNAFIDDLFSFDTLSSWSIWGLIIVIHAFTVFVLPKVLGYDWEERKIERFMQEELNRKK